MGNFKDLTGQKFGRLTVVKRGESTKNRESRWWCKCDCGNPELILVRKSSLENGHTQSCGCLQRETTRKMKKKYNTYILKDGYYSCFTEDGMEFFIDEEDYEKIKNYYWNINPDGYVYNRLNGKTLFLHRLIMDAVDENICIDHIHGKETRNDNRKSNLRKATTQENAMNKPITIRNKSGTPGVFYDKERKKYRASIGYKNKNITIGRFDTKEEAIKARKEAEEKYFGEYSYDNSQKYGINEN